MICGDAELIEGFLRALLFSSNLLRSANYLRLLVHCSGAAGGFYAAIRIFFFFFLPLFILCGQIVLLRAPEQIHTCLIFPGPCE